MASSSRLLRANPYFLVDDVFESAEYYRDILGFHFHQFWGDPPGFVMVIRDGVQIMLAQPATEREQTVVQSNRAAISHAYDVYVYVNDVDALYAELQSRGAKVLGEPRDQPHDCREFEVQDLNGYVLCFGQDLLSKRSQ